MGFQPAPATTGAGDRSPSREMRTQLQFVGFQLDGTDYAIPIMTIREIILMRPITRIPQVPAYIEGLINLRGLVIPIVNLRARFGLSARGFDEETRTIVTSLGDKTVGCIVDAVTQVMRIPSDAIQPAPASMTANVRRFVSGLAEIEGRLLVLLDLESLLEADRLELPDLDRAVPEDRPAQSP